MESFDKEFESAGGYGRTPAICHNPDHAHLTREDAATCREDQRQAVLDDMRY